MTVGWPCVGAPGRLASNASWWSFVCTFRNVDFAFVRIDGHVVCQHGAFNSTGPGDPGRFRLRSKQEQLAVLGAFYHTRGSAAPATAELRWCEEGDRARCALLPPRALRPALPAAEQRQRAMQRGMAMGWGSWLHRDALSIALLPDSALLTVMLCRISTGECLRQSNIDGNGGGGSDLTHPVRVGSHAINHSYSQLFAWGPPGSLRHVNVSIEYAVGARGSERELDVLVTPIAVVPCAGADEEGEPPLADFAVAFAGSFAWGRVGTVDVGPAGRTIRLRGHGLEAVQLTAASGAAADPVPLGGVVPPGLLGGQPCQFGSKACGSQTCAQNTNGNIACASGVCQTPAGAPWAPGRCTRPARLPHLHFALGAGPIGLTTRASSATLAGIQARVAAAAAAQQRHERRFGAEHAELAQALGAAISWRNVYVPAEPGPIMPTTFGFSWIDVGPSTNDWRYIQFGWDNILASFTAGVLGPAYKEAAYSNLIGIIMAKGNDGYVPNPAAGGASLPPLSRHSPCPPSTCPRRHRHSHRRRCNRCRRRAARAMDAPNGRSPRCGVVWCALRHAAPLHRRGVCCGDAAVFDRPACCCPAGHLNRVGARGRRQSPARPVPAVRRRLDRGAAAGQPN